MTATDQDSLQRRADKPDKHAARQDWPARAIGIVLAVVLLIDVATSPPAPGAAMQASDPNAIDLAGMYSLIMPIFNGLEPAISILGVLLVTIGIVYFILRIFHHVIAIFR